VLLGCSGNSTGVKLCVTTLSAIKEAPKSPGSNKSFCPSKRRKVTTQHVQISFRSPHPRVSCPCCHPGCPTNFWRTALYAPFFQTWIQFDDRFHYRPYERRCKTPTYNSLVFFVLTSAWHDGWYCIVWALPLYLTIFSWLITYFRSLWQAFVLQQHWKLTVSHQSCLTFNHTDSCNTQ